MGSWWTKTTDGLRVTVRVSPGSRRSDVVGVAADADALRVRVAAQPVDGQANRELERVLAQHFGVRRRAVTVVHGDHSRTKVVDILGGDDLVDRAQELSER
jgi:uncharacterized protein (TIGR00251 family)